MIEKITEFSNSAIGITMLIIIPAIAMAVIVLYRNKTIQKDIFSGSASPVINIFRIKNCNDNDNDDENYDYYDKNKNDHKNKKHKNNHKNDNSNENNDNNENGENEDIGEIGENIYETGDYGIRLKKANRREYNFNCFGFNFNNILNNGILNKDKKKENTKNNYINGNKNESGSENENGSENNEFNNNNISNKKNKIDGKFGSLTNKVENEGSGSEEGFEHDDDYEYNNENNEDDNNENNSNNSSKNNSTKYLNKNNNRNNHRNNDNINMDENENENSIKRKINFFSFTKTDADKFFEKNFTEKIFNPLQTSFFEILTKTRGMYQKSRQHDDEDVVILNGTYVDNSSTGSDFESDKNGSGSERKTEDSEKTEISGTTITAEVSSKSDAVRERSSTFPRVSFSDDEEEGREYKEGKEGMTEMVGLPEFNYGNVKIIMDAEGEAEVEVEKEVEGSLLMRI